MLTVVYRTAVDLKHDAVSLVLNHVNVVTLYAMIFELHHYGVVLEFVPHGPLDEFIQKYQAGLFLYSLTS